MEIVKQRKRRLLAWILVMGLGICMWQSNVFATEGTESGNSQEPASVSGNTLENGDEGMDGENGNSPALVQEDGTNDGSDGTNSVPEDISYCLSISFCREGTNGTVESFKFGSKPKTTLIDWNPADSGGWRYQAKIDNITTLNEISFSGDIFNHKVLDWGYFEGDNVFQSISNGSSQLDLTSEELKVKVTDNVKEADIVAKLGKCVLIQFTDGFGKSYADDEMKEQAKDDTQWSITLPQCNVLNNEVGEFFVKWNEGEVGDSFSGKYVDFESLIHIMPEYSVLVEKSGNYSFVTNTEYKLNKGTWKGSDGYSYVVELENQPFFVSENGSFEFK